MGKCRIYVGENFHFKISTEFYIKRWIFNCCDGSIIDTRATMNRDAIIKGWYSVKKMLYVSPNP